MRAAALRPSDASALIIRIDLPPALEALRQRYVPDAAIGLPAHATMLYPFARPESIDDTVLELVGRVIARHASWTMRLVERRRWPGTVYAAIEPAAPAIALQAGLASAFPSLPMYGGLVEDFVPHVTIAEGGTADDPAIDADPGWDELPISCAAAEVELIVRSAAGRWSVEHRFPLRG